ncbi:MAG: hypothetical protein WA939_21785 [Nodosilinea sp.]
MKSLPQLEVIQTGSRRISLARLANHPRDRALLIQGMNQCLKALKSRLEFCEIIPEFSNAQISPSGGEKATAYGLRLVTLSTAFVSTECG